MTRSISLIRAARAILGPLAAVILAAGPGGAALAATGPGAGPEGEAPEGQLAGQPAPGSTEGAPEEGPGAEGSGAENGPANGPESGAGDAETEAPEASPVDEVIRDGTESTLEEFRWRKRPVIVFADSADDPRFAEQLALLRARVDDLAVRDVVVLTDTDPAARSALRQRLRPRGFMLVLIGKDGTIYLRKPFPWDVRELTRSIDKMPLRQQEMRERRSPEG